MTRCRKDCDVGRCQSMGVRRFKGMVNPRERSAILSKPDSKLSILTISFSIAIRDSWTARRPIASLVELTKFSKSSKTCKRPARDNKIGSVTEENVLYSRKRCSSAYHQHLLFRMNKQSPNYQLERNRWLEQDHPFLWFRKEVDHVPLLCKLDGVFSRWPLIRFKLVCFFEDTTFT